MPKSFSIRLWFFCKATMNLDIAVALTSGIRKRESDAEPRASNWSVVIPAVRLTPVNLLANSTILVDVEVDVDDNLNIAEPVASIAFSIPIFGIRPIVSTILDRAGSASSPISSPIATLIWSAAATNCFIPSMPYLPIPSFAPW